jgi:hypothetical protein
MSSAPSSRTSQEDGSDERQATAGSTPDGYWIRGSSPFGQLNVSWRTRFFPAQRLCSSSEHGISRGMLGTGPEPLCGGGPASVLSPHAVALSRRPDATASAVVRLMDESYLRRERHDPCSRERLREASQHRQISMKLNPSQPANAERGQSEPMLQHPELSFNGRASPVQVAPSLGVARDERLHARSLDPPGLGSASSGRAAPLGRAALEVGPRERPGAVLAGRREAR